MALFHPTSGFRFSLGAVFGLLLSGCSGSGPVAEPPVGTAIETPGIEGYVTNHNGYTRAVTDLTTTRADAAVLRQFDTTGSGPEGYRSIISNIEQRYRDNMSIEVIAEIADGSDQVTRILRITADQAPFDNLDNANQPVASGQYFFRGVAEVYAVVDGGALQRGVGELQNMIVDFDTQTVSIDLRTPLAGDSQIETEISVTGVPLNIVNGTFGGEITMTSRLTAEDVLTSTGYLRGNLAGSEQALRDHLESLTTSGVFQVGSDSDRLQATGVFWGGHPNLAAP